METYHATKDPDKSLPPQAAMIVQLVRRNPTGLSRDELVEMLTAAVQVGTLKTAQPPTRILAYYKPVLVKQGWLSVVDTEAAAGVETAPAVRPTSVSTSEPPVRPKRTNPSCLSIRLPGEAECAKYHAHRVFKLPDAILVLTGRDLEDNELWVVAGDRATLVGTLGAEAYAEACRSKELVLKLAHFDWTNSKVTLPEPMAKHLGWVGEADCSAHRSTAAVLPENEVLGIY